MAFNLNGLRSNPVVGPNDEPHLDSQQLEIFFRCPKMIRVVAFLYIASQWNAISGVDR